MPTLPEGYTIEPGTGRLIRIVGRECSQLEFMSRLSLSEQVALAAVRIDETSPIAVRAQLEVLKETRDNTSNKRINLDDPRTALGAQIALSVLASLPEDTPGRIDPTDVPARLAAWLADFPQPGEAVL
jgi:hypothetical protein